MDDRQGYDSDKTRTRLREQGIPPCISSRWHGNKRVRYSKRRYKMGQQVENLFTRLKDWRRIAARYDRCASMFRSAVLLGRH